MIRKLLHHCVVGIVVASGVLAASGDTPADSTLRPDSENFKFFEAKVRPLLIESCLRCHGEKMQKGNLRLDSLEALMKGGETGPAIVPGNPSESLLVQAINYASLEMPPDEKLPAEKIAILTEWITRGAPWPERHRVTDARAARSISDAERSFWSFKPLQAIAPPDLQSASSRGIDANAWCRTDIDRFVLEKMLAAGLAPSQVADRPTLIRRAYFDLWGLPPSASDIANFVRDPSPRAYEELIDRLLDSPHYGERWARHWLDLVRYAESDGFKQDAYRPEAWRYRDYVIKSLNDDKPYDRFVQEQIAGDELAPLDPDVLPATSYLRHWIYEYNQRDVRTQWHNILNDVTDVTAEVFLGVSLACARCHDHKFDPILQRDYFGMQAFFAALLPRDDIPLVPSQARAEFEQNLASWNEQSASIRAQIEELENPIRAAVSDAAINKFPPDIRPMIRKRPAERNAYEQQLTDLAMRQVHEEFAKIDFPKKLKGDARNKWEALKNELGKLGGSVSPISAYPMAFTVSDVSKDAPRTLIPGSDAEAVEPGVLTVLGMPAPPIEIPADANTTGRRTALARWITDPQNPLSTRVIVNRIWQYHFGKGLVATSSDFGKLGESPSHPELLDWLARDFTRNGWKLKRLHRLIMTSAAYQQASTGPIPPAATITDPENRLLWRMNPRRLDGEQIRDAMLAASGELDLEAGGAPDDYTSRRRTIYVKVMRNRREPLLEVFDAPDGFNSTARRNTTTTPTQSLLMINGPWTLARANELAKLILSQDSPSETQVAFDAYRAITGRSPDSAEWEGAVAFLQRQTQAAQENRLANLPLGPAFGGRVGDSIVFGDSGLPPCRLQVRNRAMLSPGDFTVEAYVQLRSLDDGNGVRTIAAQWNGDKEQTGWALGVTGKRSNYRSGNLVLQLVSGPSATPASSGGSGRELARYEVVPSDLKLEPGKAYYLAARVQSSESTPAKVSFVVKGLPSDELKTVEVTARNTGPFVGDVPFTIGGRDGDAVQNWDGQLDEVRLSNAAVAADRLLIKDASISPNTVGFWRFDAATGWAKDASPGGNDVEVFQQTATTVESIRLSAVSDLCHVLLNSNEFLYVD